MNILPATGPTNRAITEIDRVYNTDGLLTYLTIRPIRRAGDEIQNISIFDAYAVELANQIYRAVRVIKPDWSDARILQQLRVSVFMTNWNNLGQSATEVGATLGFLTGENFLQMFTNATGNGSNPDLDIYDLMWRVWINPATLHEGGEDKEATENIITEKDQIAGIVKNYRLINDDGSIGCGAHSLAIGLDLKIPGRKTRRNRDGKFTTFCLDLQNKMGFEYAKRATIFEMQEFVKIYPTYRLVIMQTVFTNPFITTGLEYIHNDCPELDHTVFIYHDIRRNHFETIKAPVSFCTYWTKNHNTSFCFKCCTSFNKISPVQKCHCGEKQGDSSKRIKTKLIHCRDCEAAYYKSNNPRKAHRCGQSACRYCTMFYKIDEIGDHRCPLFLDPKTLYKIFEGDENPELERAIEEMNAEKMAIKNITRLARGSTLLTDSKEKRPELWVWDIESHFVHTKSTTEQYQLNEDGSFKLQDNGELEVLVVKKLAQLGNYIYCKNVFDSREFEFESLEEFLEFAVVTNNGGYNYFLAHNSSGYDSRLLFETACRYMKAPPEPIFKGTRLMRLTLQKCVFQDTYMHLTDSLKNLGEGYKISTTKGWFPHLFSTLEHLEHNGKIPAKEYFDLTFSCKTKEEFDDFNVWWQEWYDSGRVWNYREQRRLYCRNDVVMLCDIVSIYHHAIVDSLKDYWYLTVSPWFFPTKAGHVHKLMLRHVHEGFNIENMNIDELKSYAQTTWCAIEPEEHYFAHKALRGGMTNICKYIHEGPMHFQDIQSAYPAVQMDKDNLYPVGSPIIEVHDLGSYPCRFCYSQPKCMHSYEKKLDIESKHRQNKLKIKIVKPDNLEEYCLSFFGILTVDVIPPTNLYHPLIQGYDHKKKKVIGSLDPIIKETIPSVVLVEAIKIGYRVTKIHRADRYVAAESKWRNGLLGDLYVAKMKNSGTIEDQDKDRIKNTFMDKFNIDLGDIDKFEDNPVLKQVAKGPVTSAWGKHAESLDHGKSVMFRQAANDGMDFYRELLINKSLLTNVRPIGTSMMFDYKDNRTMKRPELHKTYLPAAVFVTAYGRIKLWKKLVEVDPIGTPKDKLRVIMYDTDSIVYACLDHEHGHHIEEGDCLGDWETEKIEKKNKGLVKFYSIGPKSYSIVCGNGFEKMKLKGAVLKFAHFNLMSPKIMKQLVLSKAKDATPMTSKLPQMSFDYRLGGGDESMTTRYYRKIIQFHEKDVKGTFSWDDYRGYPDGFSVE